MQIPTLVSESTQVTGTLIFQTAAEIHGLVEGDIVQQSLEKTKVGRSGWVHGTLQAQGPLIIEGRVEGSITSAVLIHLLPSAQVHGSLSAPSIKIENGAILEGELKMKGASNKASLRSAA